MKELIDKNTHIFKNFFFEPPTHIIQAPGRVNLIGEHTDYNDGFVLPCAIDFATVISASQRNDSLVSVVAIDFDSEHDEFDLNQTITPCDKGWANYVRGSIKCLRDHGYFLTGANLTISGNVPKGAGLSSSASLEVAVLQAYKSLQDLHISQLEIALIAQEAENNFVGCACGIMDQLISACGIKDSAMLIDCRSLSMTPVKIPDDLEILIIDSKVTRGLVESEYNNRRKDCEDVAKLFEQKALRDVDLAKFLRHRNELDATKALRAKHVITENQRTLKMKDALENFDYCNNFKFNDCISSVNEKRF